MTFLHITSLIYIYVIPISAILLILEKIFNVQK